MNTINRDKFYASIKKNLFNNKLSQLQVNGISAILDEAESRATFTNKKYLAYMLATTYHETAYTMQPIEEYGKGKRKAYGVPKANGHIYYGRGFVQLTWDYNYEKFGIKETPEKALELKMATDILFDGMLEGIFTGRKLEQYLGDNKEEWKNARKIINSLDKADLIANYALKFYAALN